MALFATYTVPMKTFLPPVPAKLVSVLSGILCASSALLLAALVWLHWRIAATGVEVSSARLYFGEAALFGMFLGSLMVVRTRPAKARSEEKVAERLEIPLRRGRHLDAASV